MIHHLQLNDARSFRQRLIGLLGADPLPPGHALRLSPCRAVHTVGMRHAIDVVFVDEHGLVLAIRAPLRPWRATACFRARATLELQAGEVERLRIRLGDQVAQTPV